MRSPSLRSPTPSWPSETWHAEWTLLTGKAWCPQETAWETFFSMTDALAQVRRQSQITVVRTPTLRRMQGLFKAWVAAQTPKDGLLLPASLALLDATSLFSALHMPAARACLVMWCKALNEHLRDTPKQLQSFYEQLMLRLIRVDGTKTSTEYDGRSSITPLLELLARSWGETRPPIAKIIDRLESDPHPVLVQRITETHPHLLTAAMLRGTGTVVHETALGLRGTTDNYMYNWSTRALTQYATSLEKKGMWKDSIFKSPTPVPSIPHGTWFLATLHTLHITTFRKEEFAAVVRVQAALQGKSFTPQYKARALAACFTAALLKNVPRANVFATNKIHETLLHAESLWDVMPPHEVSPRLQRYILGRLRQITALNHHNPYSTSRDRILRTVEVWTQRMEKLQLHHTLQDILPSHKPPLSPVSRRRL